jgi:hypothetical protein
VKRERASEGIACFAAARKKIEKTVGVSIPLTLFSPEGR